VRAVEKETTPKGRPDPDYRRLHDIARHAIHVSETLDVAVQTMQRMLARHDELMKLLPGQDGLQEINSHLQFFQSVISSLRCRSTSNEKRMGNEIQLVFNTVAQHDASTSVKIGLATQSDSVTMKSIAFVTLTFLPPTFVSAIFSMSFFDYSAESGWAISHKFWLYWIFAVPTTLLTAIGSYYLRQYSVSTLPVDEKKRSMELLV
jgi:Mg2+ and Co2+ transporter CorA